MNKTNCCKLHYLGDNHNPVVDGECRHCGYKSGEPVKLRAYVETEGILVHIREGKEVPKDWERAEELDKQYTPKHG